LCKAYRTEGYPVDEVMAFIKQGIREQIWKMTLIMISTKSRMRRTFLGKGRNS
jgi:hypothetical protein